MNGLEISDKAVKIQPHIKVLFTSGYSKEAFVVKEKLASEIILLDKPYRRAKLLKTIKVLLTNDVL